jgi:hypothetical protein
VTIPTFNAVGFCAHYSTQGDWAFDFALEISRLHDVQLNVFHFLKDPYDSSKHWPKHLSHEELEQIAISEEKKLRLYYDHRAGEYLNVGFRLCYDDSWSELHRCLMIREFQLLILGYPYQESSFTGKPIEKFADEFISPVILVGPEKPTQYYFNSRAELLRDKFGLPTESSTKSEEIEV